MNRPADAHPAGIGPAFAYAVNAGVASDYVFRGADQTDGGVEGFGGLDLAYGPAYAGAWASNVDFSAFNDPRAYAETDLYAGWRPSYRGFDLDIGVVGYGYFGRSPNLDYAEVYLKASRAIGPLSAGVSIHTSPNYPGAAGGGYYAEGSTAYAVTPKLTVLALVGHKGVDGQGVASGAVPSLAPNGEPGYTTWTLGAAYGLTDHLSLDLRYVDTDAHRFGDAFGDHVVIEAKAAFP